MLWGRNAAVYVMILGGIKFWNVLCCCWQWHTTTSDTFASNGKYWNFKLFNLTWSTGNDTRSENSIYRIFRPGINLIKFAMNEKSKTFKICLILLIFWSPVYEVFDIQYLNEEDITNLNCFIVLKARLCYSSYIINSWFEIDFSHLISNETYLFSDLSALVVCMHH